MFCNQCGTQTPDNYKFCPACGTMLLTGVEPQVQAGERTEEIQTYKDENKIIPLPEEIISEKRDAWKYSCSYIRGHTKYEKELKGTLIFNRRRKQSDITFLADDKDIKFVMPIISLKEIDVVQVTRGFFKQEHEMIRIAYLDENGRTQLPVFKVDEEKIQDITEHYEKMKNELLEPVVHTIKTRDGKQSLLIDVMSSQMHHNEATLWSQRIVNDKSTKNYDYSKAVTNYRVFAYDNLDDIMLRSSFLPEIDDVVVVNRHVSSQSTGTSYIVGGYGNHLFGGVMPSHSQSDSNAAGDVVFMRHGKPFIIMEEVQDPDGVATMVKSVMNQLYPSR